MAEYIDREALLLSIRDDPEINGKNFAMVKRHIESIPAADVVEVCVEDLGPMAVRVIGDVAAVVRCKDCKHWHEETGWCIRHSHFIGSEGEACHPWESSDWKMLDPDDFCSYGERKETE